jgi:hypothetical protein
MNIEYKSFENPGYIIADVPEDILVCLDNEINSIINHDYTSHKKYNNYLAGNLKHQYELVESQKPVFLFAQEVARKYVEFNSKFYTCEKNYKFKMSSLWVNFQSKYEFNPLHHHSEDLSFVIWKDIPYNLKDEMDNDSVKNSGAPLASTFQFYYNTVIGGIQSHTIYTDKSHCGKMIMFPSEINHCVNPFYTSNDYRISVAGNLSL